MKTQFLLLLGLWFIFPHFSYAGNMFGSGPFRNGSPLITGVDGSYQATARSENVTGVIRFAYSSGTQTTTPNENAWVFFVHGRVCRGSVVANLNESKIEGILDEESATTFQASNSTQSTNQTTNQTQTSNSLSLPYVQLFDSANAASGTFSGKLNLKSPNGAFSGEGILEGALSSTSQVVGIAEESVSIIDPLTGAVVGSFKTGNITVSDTTYTTAASSIQNTAFKFRGVRTSTSAASDVSSLSN